MTEKNEKDFLKLLGAKGAREILEFLSERDTGQYIEMVEFVNTPTLNQRLRELLIFGLISHHHKRLDKKEEWYEITDKGRKILQHLKEMIELVTVSETEGQK